MNAKRIITTTLCLIFFGFVLAQAQDMDTELSALSGQLAGKVKDQGKKKVTVLDFTDLQGTSSGELGKYIAEQLAVDLVMEKRDFSVLDRANLKKILAEHKLTATGLVDPDNAKKLGQFAGVDALIMGTIIPKNGTVSLTAKIITTDTAEIVGAAKAQFKSDETVQQLMSKPVTSTESAVDTGAPAPTPNKKLFGDLEARVTAIKLLPGDDIYGYASLTMIITNTSATTTWGVAFNPDHYNKFNLTNERGDEFKATELSGIETAFEGYGGYQGKLTDIPPQSTIRIVSKSQVRWIGTPGVYLPYHLQTEVLYGAESQGRHSDLKKFNLVLDIK
jgi:TolB-like protein